MQTFAATGNEYWKVSLTRNEFEPDASYAERKTILKRIPWFNPETHFNEAGARQTAAYIVRNFGLHITVTHVIDMESTNGER